MPAENYRVVSALPTGTAFARYCMVLGAGRGDYMTELLLAEKFKDSPQVHATLQLQSKAAISPGTTSDSTFASPLAQYGIASEALQLIRGASIIGALEPKMRRTPFRTKIAREIGSGSGGSWVGENLSTPASAASYDTLVVEAYKCAKIVVLSDELLKLGDPASEKTVRDTVVAGVTAFLDSQFLLPTVTLSANLRPASITSGASAITSSGSTSAQINTDLSAMLAAITTDGGALTWIMKPATAYKIAATIGGTAAVDIPRTLFGIPMILSVNSPQQITLVDAAHILYADANAIQVDSSTSATIQFDDAPVDPPVSATVFRSLFQNNLWGIRVTRWIAYLRAQTGSVSYMTVSY